MIKTWSTPVHSVNEKVPCTLCLSSSFSPALNCEGYSFVRCTKCSLIQMNPQPTKEEIIARYGSAHGNDYLKYELDNEENFLKLQKLALKDIGFWDHRKRSFKGSFLDIGCATGALLELLRNEGWDVKGVEISPSADYAVKYRNLDVRKIPLEECNFEEDQFDVVHASHLIEHLKDPSGFLDEILKILKSNGTLYISTPNIAGFQAKIFGNHWRSAIFDHLFLFSKRTLIKLLKNKGFKIKRVCTWGGLAAGTAPLWLKKIIDKLAKIFGFGDVMIIAAIKN